jgi:hypothetical protein
LSKLQIVIVLLLVAAAISAVLFRSPDLDRQLAILKDTINEVPPPPSTRLESGYDRPAIRSAYVTRIYQSNLTFDDISAYYSAELLARGWRIARDRELRYYWRNLGGRELVFCKDPYELRLSTSGKRGGAPLAYGYSALWNRNSICGN